MKLFDLMLIKVAERIVVSHTCRIICSFLLANYLLCQDLCSETKVYIPHWFSKFYSLALVALFSLVG